MDSLGLVRVLWACVYLLLSVGELIELLLMSPRFAGFSMRIHLQQHFVLSFISPHQLLNWLFKVRIRLGEGNKAGSFGLMGVW